MAILPILTIPNEILKKKALPVTKVTDEDRQFLNDMLETMYAGDGCGLAAPQVGVLKRMIVIDLTWYKEGEKPTPLKLINPQIIWASEELIPYDAGCLSIPDQHGEVYRPAQLEVEYWDENGKSQRLKTEGLFAHCIHHEIDHLNGVLYIDHLSPLKRNIIVRKVLKAKKQEQPQPV
jgi:peptide deformylase